MTVTASRTRYAAHPRSRGLVSPAAPGASSADSSVPATAGCSEGDSSFDDHALSADHVDVADSVLGVRSATHESIVAILAAMAVVSCRAQVSLVECRRLGKESREHLLLL